MALTLTWFESTGFMSVGALRTHCVFTSSVQQRDNSPAHCECLSDYHQIFRDLWTCSTVHDKTCPSVYRISFWALLTNASFQCCNWKGSGCGHIFTWTRSLVLVRGAHPTSLFAHFRFTLYIGFDDMCSSRLMLLQLFVGRALEGTAASTQHTSQRNTEFVLKCCIRN